MPISQQKKRIYIDGLDGLRAIAVLMVLTYHFRSHFVKGGFIGVDIFFVLSAYLITNLLNDEWQKKETIDIQAFWKRRFRRLIPAVVAVILVTFIAILFFSGNSWLNQLKDSVAALTYTSNWWYIYKKVPYADFFTQPTPLKHLWSLAVEAQFYLIYPFIFVYLKRKENKAVRTWQVWGIFALISAILMGLLYQPESFDRVYYGTDTRFFSFMIGAILGTVWPWGRLNANPPQTVTRVLDITGIISFSVLMLLAIRVTEFQKWMYPVGFIVVSVFSALLIAVIAHPGSRVHLFFERPLLRWIGQRSYSIYLWHYPIIILTTPSKLTYTQHFVLILLQCLLIFVLAHFSYLFIEQPLKRSPLKKWGPDMKQTYYDNKRIAFNLLISSFLLLSLIVGTNVVAAKTVEKQAEKKAVTHQTAVKEETGEETQETVPIKKQSINKMIVIGDSIILGAENELKERFPGIIVDAHVGRQMSEGIVLLEEKYHQELGKETLLIVELGSNGPFSKRDLNHLLSLAGNSHVMFINAYVPLNWQDEVNQLLWTATHEDEKLTLVDWYSVAQSNLQLLEEDGVHLNPDGASVYVDLIQQQLQSFDIHLEKP